MFHVSRSGPSARLPLLQLPASFQCIRATFSGLHLGVVFNAIDSIRSVSHFFVHLCRELEIGVSAQQKLAKLLEVIKLLGFESLCVFGDSFDEVALLDPQSFPGAIKQFAKEVWPDSGSTGRP